MLTLITSITTYSVWYESLKKNNCARLGIFFLPAFAIIADVIIILTWLYHANKVLG